MKSKILKGILILLIISFLFNKPTIAQWIPLNGPIGGAITCIAQKQISPTETHIFVGTFKSGIYISTDSGLNWSKTNLAIDKTINGFLVNNSIIYACNSDGIFRTTDEGASWINVDTTIKNVRTLSMNDSYIFAASYSQDGTGGLYISSNNGDSWMKTKLIQPLMSIKVNEKIWVASWYNALYYSIDKGNTWTKRDGPPYEDIYNITINNTRIFVDGSFYSDDTCKTWIRNDLPYRANEMAIDGNDIYAACYGEGVYKSIDNGQKWTISGLKSNHVESLSISNSKILVGSDNGSLFCSTNGGADYINLNASLYYRGIASVIRSNNAIFVASEGSIYRSTNAGIKWTIIGDTTIKFTPRRLYYYDSTLFACTGNYPDPNAGALYSSTDNGTSWKKLGLPNECMYCMAVDSTNIYVATLKGNIYHSSDGGNNFIPTSLTHPRIYWGVISDLFIHNSIIYASDTYLYSSSNQGEKWETLFQQNCQSLIEFNNKLFLRGYNGIYFSNDDGQNWTLANDWITTSLASNDKYLFAIKASGGLLYSFNGLGWYDIDYKYGPDCMSISNSDIIIGTSSGLKYSKLSNLITSVNDNNVELPSIYSLKQNYPNPFNPTTTIEYEVPKESRVVVRVIDLLGRETDTLVNEDKTAGSYFVKFNGSNCASGVYFYQLIANGNVITKKFVLMK